LQSACGNFSVSAVRLTGLIGATARCHPSRDVGSAWRTSSMHMQVVLLLHGRRLDLPFLVSLNINVAINLCRWCQLPHTGRGILVGAGPASLNFKFPNFFCRARNVNKPCMRTVENKLLLIPDRQTMQNGAIPLRGERKVCYLARDRFFSCCDKNNIANPMADVKKAERMCGPEKADFEKDCISSWVITLRDSVPSLFVII
jgi:Cytochrome oxidase c subunit VIb